MRHAGPTVVEVTLRRAVYLRVRAGLVRQNLSPLHVYSLSSPKSGLRWRQGIGMSMVSASQWGRVHRLTTRPLVGK